MPCHSVAEQGHGILTTTCVQRSNTWLIFIYPLSFSRQHALRALVASVANRAAEAVQLVLRIHKTLTDGSKRDTTTAGQASSVNVSACAPKSQKDSAWLRIVALFFCRPACLAHCEYGQLTLRTHAQTLCSTQALTALSCASACSMCSAAAAGAATNDAVSPVLSQTSCQQSCTRSPSYHHCMLYVGSTKLSGNKHVLNAELNVDATL